MQKLHLGFATIRIIIHENVWIGSRYYRFASMVSTG